MRVLATHGDSEVEADVVRDGDDILVKIGDREHRFRVQGTKGGRVELDIAGRLHIVELDGVDLRVDGRPYPITLRRALPNVPGAMKGGAGAGGVTKVKPPMPGKVVKVAVSTGDHVQPGDVLVILEAMKMQNEIVSPVEGTVRSVGVETGESIDAKRVLVEIE